MRCQVCNAHAAYLRRDRGRIVCQKCYELNNGGFEESCVEVQPGRMESNNSGNGNY